ncbi:hypothetical protein PMIT1306_00237 [Prochlorococcus sp. MIT 1306]|nr:hypothetical protein PMIT1306_00237 [Prochlorococcus sp. MIT 1306]
MASGFPTELLIISSGGRCSRCSCQGFINQKRLRSRRTIVSLPYQASQSCVANALQSLPLQSARDHVECQVGGRPLSVALLNRRFFPARRLLVDLVIRITRFRVTRVTLLFLWLTSCCATRSSECSGTRWVKVSPDTMLFSWLTSFQCLCFSKIANFV